jgi:DNA-binding transcriptional MerR regulator/methylmalonyl-CoA mutase cobalamin-binding subunit
VSKSRLPVDEPLHPIQVVARRTGLTQDAIRVWERRYAAVTPLRTGTNRRLYTEEEIDRLILLRKAVLGGRPIRDVARLEAAVLARLVADDESAAERAPRPAPPPPAAGWSSASERIRRAADALDRMDVTALRMEIQRASHDLAVPEFLEAILVPFLRHVGNAWERAQVSIAQEHLASAVVRATLHALLEAHDRPHAAPVLVLATPPGQRHELGALSAAVVAAMEGLKVHFLGADLPPEEIVGAVRRGGARAVGLSFAPPAPEAGVARAIAAIADALPEGTVRIAGGAAAGAYAVELAAAGFRVPGEMGVYREILRGLRSPA